MQFLKNLKSHVRRKKAVLLVDNLSVHRTKAVRELATKLGIELVYNGTYSSSYMPIERLWAWAKQRFSRYCAKDAPYHNQSAMRKLVRDVIYENYEQGLSKHVVRCMKMMKEWLDLHRNRSSY